MSPGSASVPAGRGFTTRRRYRVCFARVRSIHRVTMGAHSMSFRPPTGTHATATSDAHAGDDQARPAPPFV